MGAWLGSTAEQVDLAKKCEYANEFWKNTVLSLGRLRPPPRQTQRRRRGARGVLGGRRRRRWTRTKRVVADVCHGIFSLLGVPLRNLPIIEQLDSDRSSESE